jgi:hypothetical protein
VIAQGVEKMVAADGFHLSADGHEYTASLVCDKIRELRNEPPKAPGATGRTQGYVVPDYCAPNADQPLTVPAKDK